jgi:dihydrofolate synthase/folylpolyglutamate synthase
MTYPEAAKYLNSLTSYEKSLNYSYKKDLKLARIKGFLSLLENPQKYLRIIHIAGTKGKGSTCALVAYILRASGFSVGLYTSPHLSDFRERIRILWPLLYDYKQNRADFEGMISKQALLSSVKELKPLINKYNRYSKYGPLTFFEVYTALAFLFFRRKQVDFVVLETGLGGRLDATNAAESLVCGITPISLEHVQKLGNTLGKIAVEKLGIIKRTKAIVISALQSPAVQKVIRNRCNQFQAQLYVVGKEIRYARFKKSLTINGLKDDYKNLQLNLLGEHQRANAALAVGLVEGLSFFGFNFKASAIRRGLYNAVWPGRCEIIQRNPLIILDGAQNLASANVLKKAIKDNFSYKKLILVLGVSSDKDISGICKVLSPLADSIILTRAANLRAADPQKLAGHIKKKPYLTQSVKEARFLAESLADKKDLILVAGSLFLVGEFRNVGK